VKQTSNNLQNKNSFPELSFAFFSGNPEFCTHLPTL